jgi:hypothetical protein
MAKVRQLKPSQKQVEDAVRTLLSWGLVTIRIGKA